MPRVSSKVAGMLFRIPMFSKKSHTKVNPFGLDDLNATANPIYIHTPVNSVPTKIPSLIPLTQRHLNFKYGPFNPSMNNLHLDINGIITNNVKNMSMTRVMNELMKTQHFRNMHLNTKIEIIKKLIKTNEYLRESLRKVKEDKKIGLKSNLYNGSNRNNELIRKLLKEPRFLNMDHKNQRMLINQLTNDHALRNALKRETQRNRKRLLNSNIKHRIKKFSNPGNLNVNLTPNKFLNKYLGLGKNDNNYLRLKRTDRDILIESWIKKKQAASSRNLGAEYI